MANDLTSNTNLRLLACVLAPDGNATAAGTITWRIKSISDGNFGSDFASSVTTSGALLRLNYPTTTKVHGLIVSCGVKAAQRGIFAEASVGFSNADIAIYQQGGVYAGYLRGNGTNWTLNGDLSSFNTTLNNISSYHFNPPKPGNTGTDNQNLNYWRPPIANYAGSTADRRLEKVLSGLTGAANFGYRLVVASTGSAVTTNSSADVIEIMTTTQKPIQIPANSNNSTGFPGGNILTNDFELHVAAYLEL